MKKIFSTYPFLALSGFILGSSLCYLSPMTNDSQPSKSLLNQKRAISPNKRITLDENTASNAPLESLDNIIFGAITPHNIQKIDAYINSLSPDELQSELIKLLPVSLYDGSLRSITTKFILNRIGETTPTKGLNLCQYMVYGKNEAQREILNGWAAKDPLNAAGYLNEKKKSLGNDSHQQYKFHELIVAVTEKWAHHNPEEALAWYKEIKKGDTTHYASSLNNIFAVITEKDPKLAISILEKEKSNATFFMSKQAVVQTWARKNWDEAKAWIESSNERNKSTLYAAALEPLALTNPEKAMQELHLANKDEFNKAEAIIAQYLIMERGIAAATQWLSNNSSQKNYESINLIMNVWGKDSPTEALNWVQQLPASFGKDVALMDMAEKNVKMSQEENAALFQQVDSKDDYWERRLGTFIETWNKQDPTKARDWIKKANITSELKEKLTKKLTKK